MKRDRVFIVIALTIVACTVLLFYLGKQSKTPGRNSRPAGVQSTVSPAAGAGTTLTAYASADTVSVGEEFLIRIDIDSGGNLVTGVQLELTYDPAVIAVETVANAEFFPNPIEYAKKNDKGKGKIIFATGSLDGRKGSGIVARLKAKALRKTKGAAEILTIESTSLVTELGNTKSVLRSVKGASIVIR